MNVLAIQNPVVRAQEYNLNAVQSSVIEITSKAQFDKELKNSSVPVVVDFYASWCPPCRYIAPIYVDLANAYQGEVKFLKVNVTDVYELSNQYNITSIPTFLFFDQEGNLVDRMVGADAVHLKEKIANLAK